VLGPKNSQIWSSGVATEATSVRLKRAKVEAMSAPCEIEIGRAEQLRSSSMPGTHLTSPRPVIPYPATTPFANASSSFGEPTPNEIVHPESSGDEALPVSGILHVDGGVVRRGS